MQAAELRNRALVAATAAKAEGFTSTHDALIEIVRELACSATCSNFHATLPLNGHTN